MKFILLPSMLLFCNIFNAQVGINTNSPTATLHLQGNALDDKLKITNQAGRNDVIVKNTGNVGINIDTPTNKLEINNGTGANTGLKLTTGAGAGRFLMSDSAGNAYWNTSNIKFGSVPTAGVNLPNFDTDYYTGASISLKKGQWAVEFGAYAGLYTFTAPNVFTTASTSTVINTDSSIWCTCSLSTSSGVYTAVAEGGSGDLITGSGRAGAANMSRGTRSIQMQGKILLDVKTDDKTYYVFVRCNQYGDSVGNFRVGNVFGPAWERWFYATPL